MDIKLVLALIAVALLLMIVISYVKNRGQGLSQMTDAKTTQTIKSTDLAGSDSGSVTTNFTHSIWFYVDDWNYRYGEPKLLFARSGKSAPTGVTNNTSDNTSGFSGSTTSSTTSGSQLNSSSGLGDGGPPEPCPAVMFGAIENSLSVLMSCYSGTSSSDSIVTHDCNIPNIPLQKWTNLLISVYGRALDVYIDGKLVKTCMLPGVPKVGSTLPVIITPMGGFSGWTAQYQYWNDSTNPQDAWNVYTAGYGESMLSSIMDKYSIKISVMDGDTESNSVTL
jgi:hypothetical protein